MNGQRVDFRLCPILFVVTLLQCLIFFQPRAAAVASDEYRHPGLAQRSCYLLDRQLGLRSGDFASKVAGQRIAADVNAWHDHQATAPTHTLPRRVLPPKPGRVPGQSVIDWSLFKREIEAWRRAKISDWESGCGRRPENAAELEALCAGLPWNDKEKSAGGLCDRSQIETTEEKNQRQAHCVAQQAGQEMENVERYFPELVHDLDRPPTDNLDKLTATSEELLILAGMKPEVAKILATYDANSRAAGPVFAAMLDESGVGKEEFKTFLNSITSQDDLDRLKTLVERARQVPIDQSGGFPRTAENDGSVKAPSPGGSKDAADPRSLNGVLILGHELFGQRFPGPRQLPDLLR